MSTTTKVYTTKRRYELADIPTRQGAPIDELSFYPLAMGHHSFGLEGWIVLHSVHVDDGILQVVGDMDNGHYEWVWLTTPNAPEHCDTKTGTVHYTASGWGMLAACLKDGLTFAFDCTLGYEAKTHELA